MKNFLKNDKAFTAVDLTIAMFVIVIFAIIISSISYNTYLSSIEAKRTGVALNYAVDIFEHIGEISYIDVDASYDIFDIETITDFEPTEIVQDENENDIIKGTIGTYNLELKIENYNDADLIKILTLTITYPVSRKNTEKIELQRLKIEEF